MSGALYPLTTQEISDAERDYHRLRAAYLDVARQSPDNEVALAMIGSDMDRAFARLQSLLGRPGPFTHEPTLILPNEAWRGVEENA